MAGQLQAFIAALEDTKFTNKAIYIIYIDFKNAFVSIDYTHLLAIMIDLKYPQEAINFILELLHILPSRTLNQNPNPSSLVVTPSKEIF